ncbi:hypothetical protein AAFC00_001572 [Neodothiora populina]
MSRPRSRSPVASSRRYRERDSRRVDSLPFEARQVTKYDLPVFRPMFGLYLDLQKEIDIDTLSETEVKGRWKSFIGKWNRGELSEGWYDPTTFAKARKSAIVTDRTAPRDQLPRERIQEERESDDEYGPLPPPKNSGPSMPKSQDLQHRDELSIEEQEARRDDLRYERKMDRKSQKEAMEDLAPRAQAGTKERQLEKKREAAASNREFREAKSPGAEEVGERDLIGDDEGGIRKMIKEKEKKKSERQLRKEEALRAREAEREEKLQIIREKENKTMEMLKGLAREHWGAK